MSNPAAHLLLMNVVIKGSTPHLLHSATLYSSDIQNPQTSTVIGFICDVIPVADGHILGERGRERGGEGEGGDEGEGGRGEGGEGERGRGRQEEGEGMREIPDVKIVICRLFLRVKRSYQHRPV